MKRISTIVVALCSVALIFTSCKKDEDLTSLIGTQWEVSYPEDESVITDNLSFASTTVIWNSKIETPGIAPETWSEVGNYVYEAPNVTITFPADPDSGEFVLKGVVNGNTMLFPKTADNDEMVLTRK